MSLLIKVLILQGLLVQAVFAAQQKSPQMVNQVLFFESAQSWTLRDLQLFEKLKQLVLHKPLLSQYVENGNEDFMLSRLSAREAKLFEVTVIPIKLNETQKKALLDYANNEINQELAQMSSAIALIELKEVQLKQKLRFKTWFDLLKRKYQVKVKAPDFL